MLRMDGAPQRDAIELAARLDRIRKLTDELQKKQDDSEQQRLLADRIRGEVDEARKSLKPLDR